MKDALGSAQTLLVLGGGSDIGLATAKAMAGERTRSVVLAGRDPDGLASAVEAVHAAGATDVEAVRFDADDADAHEAFLDDVFARHGDVDVVLLAFGVLGDQERDLRDPASTRAVLNTNFVAAASVLLCVAERLRRQGHGSIVVLSSVAAERGRRSNFVYGSSKAGLDAFCQGLGDELAGDGIQVMVVRPGFVHTKMTEGKEAAPLATTPEVVAKEIVEGLRRGADTVWAPKPLRLVFSGLRHLPRSVFRRLDL